MSDTVKKYIQEQFAKARQDHPVAPARIANYAAATIELVQPVAEPVARNKPVQYSNQNVYEISDDVRRESLDALFERCVKSLKY